MTDSPAPACSFADMGLAAPVVEALNSAGYETPTHIQAETIPALLDGRDVLGRAPTGTGKTAAFALPLISRLEPGTKDVQVLVLAPTRELAIQVAEAFQRYAGKQRGFHVLPLYGGQAYVPQIKALKRGAQVVVGTPGRVMDHMRKGTLKLESLRALVLDEADEMLRMGFIDDVEWVLEQTPPERQIALFSATMPAPVERIARRHLQDPHEVEIRGRATTAPTIRQRFWLVSGLHKLDALTRILEVEPFDGVIIFVRTKTATQDLAERLEARGYRASALNGDMPQAAREQMLSRLKRGTLDILVATDVAARGIDVDRISHVINFDIPYDSEAYVHRIGRTGRAGRHGEAILFVAPRERRMLASIERATGQKIERLELPSTETVNNQRIANFKQRIADVLAEGELEFLQSIVEAFEQEHDVPATEIAAALARMALGEQPLLLPEERIESRQRGRDRDEGPRGERRPKRSRQSEGDVAMETFRIAVGHNHGVKPGNIMGAIANEAGLDGAHIGRIEITPTHSLVDLPRGMPPEIFAALKKARVCGQKLDISRVGDDRGQIGGQSGGQSVDSGVGQDVSDFGSDLGPAFGNRKPRGPARDPESRPRPKRAASAGPGERPRKKVHRKGGKPAPKG